MKEMKQLDDFIKSNAGQFDSGEPPEGHFERFEGRLAAMRRSRTGTLTMVMRIAAMLLIGLFITYASVREFNIISGRLEKTGTGLSNTEFNEAEQFYTSQLGMYYSKIENLRFNNDKTEKMQVLKELSDMDIQIKAMKQDLLQNPDDERIVHAIINFYQVKIEMMDMIIARTEQLSNSIL
jgi:hypothetical protein